MNVCVSDGNTTAKNDVDALQRVDLKGSGSTCMLPRELIWERVAPPVYSPGSLSGRGGSTCMLPRELIWKGWLHLYAPQGVDMGGDGFTCMLPRELI